MKEIYVVLGTIEEIGQTYIGGDFEASYSKELVIAFNTRKQAQEYVNGQKLAKPKKDGTYSGVAYYKHGYYDLDIETVKLED